MVRTKGRHKKKKPAGAAAAVSGGAAVRRDPSYAGEAVPESQALSDWLDSIVVEVGRVVREALAPATLSLLDEQESLEALEELMEELWRVFDSCVEQAELTPGVACKRGCHHCCYNPISLTPAEALVLGRYAERTLDQDFLRLVRGRAEAQLLVLRGRSRAQMGEVRHELLCPFIEGGTCMVHHARPLVCRGWNSLDAAACERSIMHREPQALIENHALPRQVADSLQLGLLRGTSALHLEAGYLALPRAAWLLNELGADSSARSWLSMQPFFGSRKQW